MRGPAAPRRRSRQGGRDGHHRRPAARRQGDRHRQPDHGSGRRQDARSDLQPARRADRRRRPGGDRGAVADPPPGARARGPHPDPGDARDRGQGPRPARALRQGRQGRPVRRRRRGQDRDHPRADPQHRHQARRAVGVLRRRRADPRGQRALHRDAGVRRHRQDDDGLRADERAARRAAAGRPLGPDDGRVLPRGRRPGRAAVHRQHLPLRPGGVRGLGAARADAVGGRLPADARDRDGRAPGADHLDLTRLGHLGAGDLRAGRRPHRSRAGVGVRAPQRDHRAVAVDLRRRGSIRRSTRSTPPRRSSSRRSSARSTTRPRPGSRRSCSATRSSRTSSRSSGSTSSPTRTS